MSQWVPDWLRVYKVDSKKYPAMSVRKERTVCWNFLMQSRMGNPRHVGLFWEPEKLMLGVKPEEPSPQSFAVNCYQNNQMQISPRKFLREAGLLLTKGTGLISPWYEQDDETGLWTFAFITIPERLIVK